MKRILIVNVNWLGDTLFATPFIRAVRENYKDSYIAVLTHPRCVEVLRGNPYIDEFIIYDEKNKHRHFLEKFAVISDLKQKKFDIAFILRKSLTRTMLLFLSRIPERIGYSSKRAGFLLTKKIKPLAGKSLHKVEYFLNLARASGINPSGIEYDFFIPEEDLKKGEELLKQFALEENNFIVMNPGGNWDLKRWPLENFAKLGDRIYDRYKIKVVLTGSEKDIDLCNRIYSLMKNKPVLLCGKTTLKTLGVVFKRSRQVISNDSGPMHIATAVKANIIALFGPTDSSITGPYGRNGNYQALHKNINCAVPCYKLSCKNNLCMKAISVADVMELLK